ncbi:GIY-YIG nuclease family protein [Rhodohalobacter sp. SW132]|uniref:GIY-YIG nuclease family protein n=1 Tax=Rhodohalobacter sp. SW132 TaxID=2293433 RepID=UPI000E267E25|nr:GIY-YIG nuclease family protein [Rhodohalobacter sp. SW132]REL38429.1 GIY-YIG nuclease family protein [Rhodohalobacter sp. SW132]
MKHTVFVLYSPLVDRYFVGSSSNPEKAINRHNSGKNKHTKSGIPWRVVCQKTFDTVEKAKEAEASIKSSGDRTELESRIEKLK